MDSERENHTQPALNTASLVSAPKEAVLSAGQIADFQALYFKQFGKEISKKEALEKGLRLLRLMEAVLKN